MIEKQFPKSGAGVLSFKEGLKVIWSFNIIFLAVFVLFLPSAKAQRLIVVEKSARVLSLYEDNRLINTFPCSLGWNPHQPKTREGDGATPEGLYRISDKHPSQRYYLFLEISYPNLKDIQRAYWEGRLSAEQYQEYCKGLLTETPVEGPLGGNIGIHGGGLFRSTPEGLQRDWTYGCIALKNKDIEVVYRFASVGTPVLIYDASKPLFDIFSQLVTVKTRSLLLKSEPWAAEFEMSFPQVMIRLILKENHRGNRRLWIWGYEPGSGRLLFWIVDRNGNGYLEPLDKFKNWGPEVWSYRAVKRIILQYLPQWISRQEEKRRGEPLKWSVP